MDPEIKIADDTPISVDLRMGSWRNLIHVIHEWGIKDRPWRTDDAYREEFGDFPSKGGFWATVQAIESQIQKADRLYAAETRAAVTGQRAPLTADDPLVVDRYPCFVCGKLFVEGDTPEMVGRLPATDKDALAMASGEDYTALAQVVHEACAKRVEAMDVCDMFVNNEKELDDDERPDDGIREGDDGQ